MHWLILIISGLFEAVWATALGKSEGLTRLTPTLVFIGGLVLSMVGLAYRYRLCCMGGDRRDRHRPLRHGDRHRARFPA